MSKRSHHEIASARPPTKLGQTHRIYEVRPRERRGPGQPSTSDQPAPNGRLSAPQQRQWDETSALRAKKMRDGLSVSSQKVLDDVRRTESVGLGGADGGDESEWMDCVDSGVPMDSEITVSAEGDEVAMLLETVGISRKRPDARTWGERLRTQQIKWAGQLDDLTDAYLMWQYHPVIHAGEGAPFNVEYIDIYDYSPLKILTHDPRHKTWATTLLAHGCLSGTPDVVGSVMSLRTLELYRRLRLRHPQLSVQAYCRVICDLNKLHYHRTMWQRFTDTFDIYLSILRQVDKRIAAELGRDTDNWRMLNSCPCCQHKLKDEDALSPAIQGAMDGGQSLRRVAMREDRHEDQRTYTSKYLLSEAEVDVFKYDVKARAPRKKKKGDNDPPTWIADTEQAGAADGDTEGTTCTDKWQAASSDLMKRMWAIYRESGIFLAVCRHGMVWIIMDMIRSGELAKYPLAIINHLIRVFGPGLAVGYDIACSFQATVSKSSLARLAIENALKLVVPAFHGYAHNRVCQLSNHPLYTNDQGIEDFEGCERCFSSSNNVARLTRHATRFHRHQAMDNHFEQWDVDKYAELGTFLYNNYKQVGVLLTDMPIAIAAFESGKTAEECDYVTHLNTERAYLANRKKEPEADEVNCKYITLLLLFKKATDQFDEAHSFATGASAAVKARLANVKINAFDLLTQLRETLMAFEALHDIPQRWVPESRQWKDAVEYLKTRDFQKALDKLEALVIQRLFELSKMGLAGTGYKLRVHINKGLKARCKAIQTALKKYNLAAAAIKRPPLDWKGISKYASIAEFSLLRECREDIRSQPWALAANRQAGVHSLKLASAHVERKRLNYEVRRLATSMRDEERTLANHITRLVPINPPLAMVVTDMRDRRIQVNNQHRRCIEEIYSLPHFNGRKDLGVRAKSGSAMDDSEDEGMDLYTVGVGESPMVVALDPDDEVEPDEDDYVTTQLDNLEIWMGQLSVLAVVDDNEDE